MAKTRAMMDVRERVLEVLAEQFGVDLLELQDGRKLIDDLGAEELDVVEAEMAVEEELGVEIPDEALADAAEVTVGAVVAAAEQAVNLEKRSRVE